MSRILAARRRTLLAATAAAFALLAPAAVAAPSWRVEVRVGYDGSWTLGGERVIDPASPPPATTGTIELWRGGAKVVDATGAADPAGFVTLARTASTPPPQPGDEVRYLAGGTLRAKATYTGRPAVAADACAGATSFGASHDGPSAGGLPPALSGGALGGAPLDGTATATSADALRVDLPGALQAGQIAWVVASRELAAEAPAETFAFGARGERLVTGCSRAATPTTGTPPLAGLGDGGSALNPAPPPAAPAPQAPAPDRTAPAARVQMPRRFRVRDLRTDGFALGVTCGEPCAATLAVAIPAGTARRLGLTKRKGKAPFVLGLRTVRLPIGAGVVRVVPARRARQRLRKARSLKLSVGLRTVDAAGNVASATRSLNARR